MGRALRYAAACSPSPGCPLCSCSPKAGTLSVLLINAEGLAGDFHLPPAVLLIGNFPAGWELICTTRKPSVSGWSCAGEFAALHGALQNPVWQNCRIPTGRDLQPPSGSSSHPAGTGGFTVWAANGGVCDAAAFSSPSLRVAVNPLAPPLQGSVPPASPGAESCAPGCRHGLPWLPSVVPDHGPAPGTDSLPGAALAAELLDFAAAL